MSVATQIERLQGIKSQIKTKMINLDLSTENETLQELADDLDTVVNRGDASATLSASARSKTLEKGYYTGGKISIPPEYYPITSTNTTATASDVLSGKKFVDTAGNTITGNIATASSSNITGTVSVTNPSKITLKTSSATGSSTGSANASATISKQLYTGSSGVTNSSLGTKDITATAEVALASSVTGSSTIPSTLPTGTVQVSPSTTKTIYSDTSSTSGYIKSFVVDSIKTETKTATPATSAFDVTPSENGKFLTKVTVNAIPNQKTGSDVSASVSTSISNITSIDASQKTNGITITANSNGNVTVPLGFYAQQVTKAPSSSASTTIKPALAGTSGTIELTAGTSAFTKTSVDNYANGFITAVTINPTPSQAKSATPSTTEQTISPDNGKLLSSVAISAIPTETKSITAGTSASTTSATSGKFITSVTVNPTPSQSKSVTPKMVSQTVSPDSGKLLSSVTVNAVPSISVTLSSGSWGSDSNTTIGKYYYNVSSDYITASNNLFAMPESPSTAQSFGTYLYSQGSKIMQFRSVAQPSSNLKYTVYFMS